MTTRRPGCGYRHSARARRLHRAPLPSAGLDQHRLSEVAEKLACPPRGGPGLSLLLVPLYSDCRCSNHFPLSSHKLFTEFYAPALLTMPFFDQPCMQRQTSGALSVFLLHAPCGVTSCRPMRLLPPPAGKQALLWGGQKPRPPRFGGCLGCKWVLVPTFAVLPAWRRPGRSCLRPACRQRSQHALWAGLQGCGWPAPEGG